MTLCTTPNLLSRSFAWLVLSCLLLALDLSDAKRTSSGGGSSTSLNGYSSSRGGTSCELDDDCVELSPAASIGIFVGIFAVVGLSLFLSFCCCLPMKKVPVCNKMKFLDIDDGKDAFWQYDQKAQELAAVRQQQPRQTAPSQTKWLGSFRQTLMSNGFLDTAVSLDLTFLTDGSFVGTRYKLDKPNKIKLADIKGVWLEEPKTYMLFWKEQTMHKVVVAARVQKALEGDKPAEMVGEYISNDDYGRIYFKAAKEAAGCTVPVAVVTPSSSTPYAPGDPGAFVSGQQQEQTPAASDTGGYVPSAAAMGSASNLMDPSTSAVASP